MERATPGLTYWSRRIDWPLMMAVGVLVSIGIVAVYSAVTPMGSPMKYVIKQLVGHRRWARLRLFCLEQFELSVIPQPSRGALRR